MAPEPQTTVELPEDHPHIRAHRRRGLVFIGLAVGGVGFAMAIQMATNANFVADVIGISGLQQGVLEAVRESCGVVALGVLALLAGLAEPLVGACMLVLLAAGLASYFFVRDYAWLVAASLLWSQGVHVWFALPDAMTLAVAERGQAGRRLGQISAAGAAGTGLALVAAYVLRRVLNVDIRLLYVMAGAAAVLAAAACLGIPRKIKTTRPRFVFRRKYWLYYLLSFLEGWRKQIFVAFAGYLLVKQHHTSLETMLLLWIAIQAASYLAAPQAGRLIDRVGERPVLVSYFACLTVLFVGYAIIQNKHVLYGIYVADSVFFVLSIAMKTYVNRIAPPSEHTATFSMGVAMNHAAAVTMPLAGGVLWRYAGPSWTFLVGALAAGASVFAALLLPGRAKALQQA